MKKSIFAALMLMEALAANAQVNNAITFEGDATDASYNTLGVYDTWAESPFRIQKGSTTAELAGNYKVLDNPYIDTEDGTNTSAKVLGVQRSRFGSNTFGARIDLKESERFELTTSYKYVHVMINRPVTGRVMLVGLGKRPERRDQATDVEQFWVISSNTIGGDNKWYDAVFAIKGNGGIDIYSLVVVPDCESPHARTEDFAAYIDNIEVNSSATPRISYEDYPISFSKTASASRTDRYTTSVNFNGATSGEQTVTLNTDHKPYQDLTETVSVKAVAGETITPTFNYTGNAMHRYVYLDRGNDGKIKDLINSDGTPTAESDVMAYSYYNGVNSKGETGTQGNPPTFTVPSDLTPGFYRVRYKVDWDCLDPQGNATSENTITANGGSITDFLVNVHPDKVTVKQGQLNGNVQTEDGVNIDNLSVPFGQALKVKIAPAEGFLCDTILVKTGYNLDGDQYIHGNRQWQKKTFYDYQLDENGILTLPAEVMEGNVSINVFFQDENKMHKRKVLTYKVTDKKGNMVYTQENVIGKVSEAYPTLKTNIPDYCSVAPAGTVSEDDSEITVSYTSTLPFRLSTSFDDAHWYKMTVGASTKYLKDNGTDTSIALSTTAPTDDNIDDYSFCFMGDPFNGIKIMNKTAGSTKILSSSTSITSSNDGSVYPIMTTEPVADGNNTYWIPTKGNTISSVQGFYLAQKGYSANRMNDRDSKLAYWVGGADNGSTFFVEYISGPVDYPYTLTETTDFNNNIAFTMTTASRGYLWQSGENLSDSRTGTDVEAYKEFALITKNGKSYLYSVSQKKFLVLNGTSAKTTDGVPSEVTVKKNADGEYMFIFTLGGKTINLGGSSQLTIDSYNTADGGNRFKVEAVEAFDPTYALSLLGLPLKKAEAATISTMATNITALFAAADVTTFNNAVDAATAEAEVDAAIAALMETANGKHIGIYCQNNTDTKKHYVCMTNATTTGVTYNANSYSIFTVEHKDADSGNLFYLKNDSTDGYLGQFNRNNAVSGVDSKDNACLYAFEWNTTGNGKGDQTNIKNTQSTSGYYYLNDGNDKITDWTAGGASSKWTIEAAKAQSYTINMASNYATLILPYAPVLPEGFKAYLCSGITNNGYVIIDDVAKPAAHTPYIIKGTSGEVTVTGYRLDGETHLDDYTNGLLTGVLKDGGKSVDASDATDSRYFLAVTTDDDNGNTIGFYKLKTAMTCAQNKCYMTVSADNARTAFYLPGSDVPTSVSALTGDELGGAAIYNVSGQRISRSQKGLNIINGKKVIK